ncbi:MAG TPA: hypothetical protein VHL14_14995 [Steroidobacteraceae bacterium]|jgi:hypothetical protein|nr:hypothetical protein [Steroidobacteraceae bacterium]
MKSSKASIKSIVQGALLSAGMLVAGSVFADGFGHGHGRDRDFDDRGRHERHDRDFGHGREFGGRHDFDRHDHNRGGIRFVVPVPPPPAVFFPVPRPPHVSFSFGAAPAPVYITYARVVDVDPIISRSYGDWDDDTRGNCEGYRVTYEFRGREYTTVMSYDPGSRVRIRVGRGVEVLG